MNSDITKQDTNQHYNKFMTVNITVDKFAINTKFICSTIDMQQMLNRYILNK